MNITHYISFSLSTSYFFQKKMIIFCFEVMSPLTRTHLYVQHSILLFYKARDSVSWLYSIRERERWGRLLKRRRYSGCLLWVHLHLHLHQQQCLYCLWIMSHLFASLWASLSGSTKMSWDLYSSNALPPSTLKELGMPYSHLLFLLFSFLSFLLWFSGFNYLLSQKLLGCLCGQPRGQIYLFAHFWWSCLAKNSETF